MHDVLALSMNDQNTPFEIKKESNVSINIGSCYQHVGCVLLVFHIMTLTLRSHLSCIFFPFIKARRHLNTPSVQAIDRWLVASNGTQIN
jgi:hypothetical protein